MGGGRRPGGGGPEPVGLGALAVGLGALAVGLGPVTVGLGAWAVGLGARSEEDKSELQSLMRSSYAVYCLKKKNKQKSSAVI